jgi:hypothetical protein
MRQTLMAGASSFAHLLGRAPKASKAAGDEDDKKAKRAADDELDDEKGDGDDEGDGPKDGKKSKRAESPEQDEENDETKERDEEEDGDAKKSKKAGAKRAKADDGEGDDGESGDDDEEGDDGSDGADMRRKGARSARLRERARCAAIFSDASAGKNPALAAQLAFGTDLPRSQAINVLKAGGLAVASAPRRPSLDERMAAVKVPSTGAGDASRPDAGSQSVAQKIIAAGKRARGEA